MKKNKLFLIIFLLLLLGVTYGINRVFRPFDEQIIKYPSNLGSFNETGVYEIDSKTILALLKEEDADIFSPKLSTSWPYTPVSQGDSPGWHQLDYLEIVSSLHRLVWNETLATWKIYYMGFETACKDASNGFSIGELIYFKTVWHGDSIFYSARGFLILPLDNEVAWGGETYFPHPIFGWNDVDLEKSKIDAESALLIAEERGGRSFRSTVDNNCTIRLDLSGDYGWKILYSSNNATYEFEIFIDPYTGNVTD